jgi:hypothetical protein
MEQSQGGEAVNHIVNANKMVIDTPRTNNYDWSFHLLFAEAQKMERELSVANKRIKELEAKVDQLHDLEKWLEGR